MQDRQSSNLKPQSRFSGIHVLATSFAAVAGVAIAAYQALGPHSEAPPAPPPVQVTVAVDPVKTADVTDVSKGDAAAGAGNDIGQGAGFSAALNDGSDQRYKFADLFDGNPQSQFSISEPDSEVNVLMRFPGGTARTVRAIEYTPPNAGGGATAAQLDVMVLPDGQMNGSGSAIQSYSLQTTPGKQTFELPGAAEGRALWLRIAGPSGQGPIQVGEFRVLK